MLAESILIQFKKALRPEEAKREEFSLLHKIASEAMLTRKHFLEIVPKARPTDRREE